MEAKTVRAVDVFAPPPPYEATPSCTVPGLRTMEAPQSSSPQPNEASGPRNMGQQRACVAARLPAYRNTRLGHYRAHPYRRSSPTQGVQSDDDGFDPVENISIADIVNSPRYICVTAFGFDPQEQPSLTDTFNDPPPIPDSPMNRTERINFLAARVADIDAATSQVNAYALNDLEGRVLDFVLFVRRQLVEQRELAVLSATEPA
ncbi:uncharacterized protein SCHCODRAFT_02661235 [Schizophyllum commune H4-8]|uniref:uncharacterized protein n=1 Tax=Schizophyllum commune (strain H4-8 / FGSC 9210) TaxID=578458 RepID=UPI00215E471E|nr:uncharacterized protein SCHCODRAFT_02661235 [Schizophyllum commune H4-8]KAI5899625.1 hypothetical protein SCHCODRAFT_02661235 [Schizophyllum commune H4-8]